MKPTVTKDEVNKKLTVQRTFDAPRSRVWKAWTTSEQLDQWWGPKPWNVVTKSFTFSEGGRWLYNMQGPDGSAQWCLFDYQTIDPENSFSGVDAFCDEAANKNPDMPSTRWHVRFEENDGKTTVTSTLSFDTVEAMNGIIEMGFEEGFGTGLNQLDELLAK
jgi:PhnB protein